MTTKEGVNVKVVEYIEAWQIDENDLVCYQNDYFIVDTKIDEGDILVKGVSEISGDNVSYLLTADTEVGLWRADLDD